MWKERPVSLSLIVLSEWDILFQWKYKGWHPRGRRTVLWRFWTQSFDLPRRPACRAQILGRSSTEGQCTGCERKRFPDRSCIRFWRLIKTIWPCTLCCILLLNIARDLLISLLFLRALAGEKVKMGQTFCSRLRIYPPQVEEERVSDSPRSVGGNICISGKATNQKWAFHLWSGKSCTSVCAHVRNREKDSNHLMNCVN